MLSTWYNKICYQHDLIKYYIKIICKRMCVWWVSHQNTYIYISRYITNIMESIKMRGGPPFLWRRPKAASIMLDNVSVYVNVYVLFKYVLVYLTYLLIYLTCLLICLISLLIYRYDNWYIWLLYETHTF